MGSSRSSKRWVYFIFGGVLFSIYLVFNTFNDQYVYHTRWYERPAPCTTPKKVLSQLADMTFEVSDILNSLKINHVICYGTLWGALRIGKILPWDNNVDICVMREELDKVSWSDILEAMQAHHFETSYDSRHGELVVKRNSLTCVISVFYASSWEKSYREGWEYRFMSYFQVSPISFPSHIMEAPFSSITFHGRKIPVPHDDMELLKHLYPEDWWVERPPPNCNGDYVNSKN